MKNNIEILDTKVTQGPSYWSSGHPLLIVMKLKVLAIAEPELNLLIQQIKETFPDLSLDHATNSNKLEIIKQVAIKLQTLAGMPCNFNIAKAGEINNEFFIVFEYTIKRAGIYAGEAAVRLVSSFLNKESYDFQKDIEALKKIKKKYNIGPTTGYILNEVKKRNIPIFHYNAGSLVTLGYGCNQKKMRTAVTDTTSGLGIEIAGDKEETKQVLAQANVPVPKGIIVYSETELKTRLHEVKFPFVVKPLDGNQGRGVTTHIYDQDRALFGFNIAKQISDEVIIEEYIAGDDHRFLVINYKLVAVAKRSPAMVIGDGNSTILELINETNKDPQRGNGAEHVLAQIKIDAVTNKILSENNLTLQSIPAKDKIIVLKDTANISAGGTATDLTDEVHPHNKFMVERIAKLFNLDICGVDIVTTAVNIPITRDVGAVIEVNAGPGVRMHSNPQIGKPRDVAASIVDMLFPANKKSTIPVIAVFGTDVSALTNRVLESICSLAMKKVGMCSSDGLFSNSFKIKGGTCTDFDSLQEVLLDPMIDLAILETTHETLINYGLPFNNCDISIIYNDNSASSANVEDNLTSKNTLIQTTMKDGYSIIDADTNKTILSLQKDFTCKLALFSLKEDNSYITQHKKNGGLVAFFEKNNLVVYKGDWKTKICNVDSLEFDKMNGNSILKVLLATVLGAIIQNISIEIIKEAIINFPFKNKYEKING